MTDAEDVEMNVETKKKAKKDKKDKAAAEEGETKETKSAEPAFDPTTVTGAISIIANPLAGEKLSKKVYKLVKKAAATKSIRRGVKEVVKALRKGEKGLMVLAGNITPIDVITHIPILCEEKDIPYIYVPAKEHLGAAAATRRPTSCILVQEKADAEYHAYYQEVSEKVKAMAPVF